MWSGTHVPGVARPGRRPRGVAWERGEAGDDVVGRQWVVRGPWSAGALAGPGARERGDDGLNAAGVAEAVVLAGGPGGPRRRRPRECRPSVAVARGLGGVLALLQQLQARQALVDGGQVEGGGVGGVVVVRARAAAAPERGLAAAVGAAPVGQVVRVRDGHLLALVADQLDGAAELGGDGALEAALAQ